MAAVAEHWLPDTRHPQVLRGHGPLISADCTVQRLKCLNSKKTNEIILSGSCYQRIRVYHEPAESPLDFDFLKLSKSHSVVTEYGADTLAGLQQHSGPGVTIQTTKFEATPTCSLTQLL